MVIVILATLLILGIAFYQTVQGCFSAMITAVLTVLAAAIAFNYYEPLGCLLADRLGAAADPTALLAVFVIPLLGMRILFDRVIRGNVVLGMWPDRIGGVVFGFVTSMIMTGVLMIIMQMLPLPAAIIGWQPYGSGLGVKDGGPPRWASNFTLATVKHLSDGPLKPIMSGGNKFGVSHNDLMRESFCLRNRPVGARASTPTDAIGVLSAHVVQVPDREDRLTSAGRARLQREIPRIQDDTPPYPLLRQAEKDDTKVLVIRVNIDESARNEDDNWWRLPATHFRLVCESGRSFYPVGYLTHSAQWEVNTSVSDKLITQVGDIIVARLWQEKSKGKLTVDWLYRIPSDQKPQYVVFRRVAAAALPPVAKGLPNAYRKHGKGRVAQLALSVKSVSSQVEFHPVSIRPRPFTPELVKVSSNLPSGISIRSNAENDPAAIKQIQITTGELRNVLIDGATSELQRSKDSKARYVARLFMPGREAVLMHVRCKVNRGFRGASIIKNLKPALLLNTGAVLPHKGAYIFYNADGGKRVYFYYDFKGPRDYIDPEFAQKFRDNLAGTQTFGLIFSVPVVENTSVVGITFGVGANYEFHTVKPLECSKKR